MRLSLINSGLGEGSNRKRVNSALPWRAARLKWKGGEAEMNYYTQARAGSRMEAELRCLFTGKLLKCGNLSVFDAVAHHCEVVARPKTVIACHA